MLFFEEAPLFKHLRSLCTAAALLVLAGISTAQSTPGVASTGTWQPLANQPPFAAGTHLLLTDGTVIVQDTGANDWWKLTPDINGSYVNGTWSSIANLPAGYA